MAIVQSFGALTSPDPPVRWRGDSAGTLGLYGSRQTYAEIYRRQPNIRTPIDFIALNTAHVGLHVFRRVSDTDRVRLPDHELAQWIKRPNPWTSRFRLFENLLEDLGIYSNAYWLKVRTTPMGLLRLPPDQMTVEGGLYPTLFVWQTPDGRQREFPPSELVYFRWSSGHDPDHPVMGVSRLETLRRTIAEEAAAGENREGFWRNAARIDGIVTRPKEVKRYTDTQLQSWREQWQAAHAGSAQSGKTVLLQDGETFTPTAWSAKDSEYIASRKQAREECAAANHVPQPFVGILDHATFSNIKEQHKHLYQDTLGPPFAMIEEEIELQLLPECADTRDVYVEFNIAEKLKGSFEEQATSLQAAVGRPYMTVNEARAKVNLPSHDDPTADDVAPQQGGPASASQPPDPQPADTPPPVGAAGGAQLAPVIAATRDRQHARLAKLPVTDRPAAFAADLDRWNRELAVDLATVTGSADESHCAAQINGETLRQLEDDARDARIAALEQKPEPKAEIPPQTINVALALTPAEREKSIAVQRDRAGAVTGYVVK